MLKYPSQVLGHKACHTSLPARAAQGPPGGVSGGELEGLAHVHSSHHWVLLMQQETEGPGPTAETLLEWLHACTVFIGVF